MPFASATVPRHILRGVVGLLALAGAVIGAGTLGPAALLLLAVTLVAWRGCPACWLLGLIETRERCRTGAGARLTTSSLEDGPVSRRSSPVEPRAHATPRVEADASRACTSCSLSR